MLVTTAFDNERKKPLVTSIKDDKLDICDLYLRGTNKTIYDVEHDIQKISNKIDLCEDPIFMNDVKTHMRVFGIQNDNLFQINSAIPSNLNKHQYNKLFKSISTISLEPEKWRGTIAQASKAYLAMEDKPVFLDEIRVFPRYSLDTFSGRSKCQGYNLQGAPVGTNVRTTDEDIFVCCDWISADVRVAAAISGDKDLNATFERSDPYTVMANDLKIARNECKIAFLRAIYSLDVESPILELFPTFKEWIYDQIYRLSSDGFLQTPLGRKFKLGSRDEKSVFNAVLQGTVAHAMQSSLSRMVSLLGEHLLTETHDAIVLVGRPGIIPHIVKAVVDIMFEPLERFPTFPLRVYIGKVWKKWKLYKEYR